MDLIFAGLDRSVLVLSGNRPGGAGRGCDSRGGRLAATLEYSSNRHIGLTPQSSGQPGRFKAQGSTMETARELIEDAKAIQSAGAFALLVEAVPLEVCRITRDTLSIPVYSIGVGVEADGQLMIVSDLPGVFQAFTPQFVKKYASVAAVTTDAFAAYAEDVCSRAFPATEHTCRMVAGELEKLESCLKTNR